ncbi:MAG: hypothetical protein CTY16_16830 [Methylobacter sp.]|nr:MAG: hypothetical protein CTY16_16830 [Methylobacter sp.]
MKAIPLAIFLTLCLSGCALQPVARHPVTRGISYKQPTYRQPGPGYSWQYHPRQGWGWRHPTRGWDKGWK